MRLLALVALLVANMRIMAVVKNCYTKILKNITNSALITQMLRRSLQFPREIYNPNDNYIIQVHLRVQGKITSCKNCKQIFVDAPNLVLEKLNSMITLPCRLRPLGCRNLCFQMRSWSMIFFALVVLLVANMKIKAVVKNCHTKILKNRHLQCSYNPRCSGSPAVPKRNLQPK